MRDGLIGSSSASISARAFPSVSPITTIQPTPGIGDLGCRMVPPAATTRLAYSSTLQVKEMEYMIAARAIGASSTRLITFYVFPNITGFGRSSMEIANLLLEEAGVDTVKELRNRNADNLADKMAEVNKEKKLTRTVPSAKTVAGWVEQAKGLDPLITH